MKRALGPLLLAIVPILLLSTVQAEEDGKLRIIAFGAHPDDCEFQMAGTAVKWTELGHHVKLVSVTNGDIGHWREAGGPLAKRRTAEVHEAARRIGTTAEVLDIHDGELLPTLENRQKITRLIREWKADIVIAHRPNDYHPDHRYTGVLVQDSAFMVAVPFFCPDVPPLKRNPVFTYFPDGFQKPNPFLPDVIVSIDDVFEKKMDAIDALVSQVYEGGALGSEETLRQRHADNPIARREWATSSWQNRQGRIADKYREALIDWYGEEAGKAVKYAEAFELCEYGRRPTREELRQLFPFFDE
ncbi:MAG: PIG-L family deacetylase [Planctomycetaceae bacterium]|nr:PIG-L family deacetylase [Planctomycetales bacterium]MCB9921789.1 PIG-L family deacetylase [Planctomycetaceae bacterium]